MTERRYGVGYSYTGADVVALNAFELLGIDKPSYLDVGAHHPMTISNTALMYERGCRGVNVEVNPTLHRRFLEDRPEDVNLCVGVAPERGVLPFYVIDDWSGRNTFSKDAADGFVRDYPQFSITKIVDTGVVTLNDVVDSYCAGKFPDFLTIDIEQLDYDVLRSTDFERSKPRLVCVETIKYDGTDDYLRFRCMMLDRGFVSYCRMVADTLFIDIVDANRLRL